MRSKPASNLFGYCTALVVGFALFTFTASTATAGPILGLVDASVVEVPFNPDGGSTPGQDPTLDVGDWLDLEEVYQFYAGGGGRDHPRPMRIDLADVLRIDESALPTPGDGHVVVYH